VLANQAAFADKSMESVSVIFEDAFKIKYFSFQRSFIPLMVYKIFQFDIMTMSLSKFLSSINANSLDHHCML